MNTEIFERYAELIVGIGANIQPGQTVAVRSELGKEELTRAIAAGAYRRGASYVDVDYYDLHVKRARVLHGTDEALAFLPPYLAQKPLGLGELRAGLISLSGPTEPDVFAGLDPERVGRDSYPRVPEYLDVVNERTVNWCVASCPNPGWATLVYPELEPAAALELLWERIFHVCRLDEPDPQAAWSARVDALRGAAARVEERRFDALHFEGSGTDLTVGLLRSSRWNGGGDTTVGGIRHMSNMPTEEIFSAPDPLRVDGVVRATKPLYTYGTIVEGIRVRFEGGRAVDIDADSGAETLRAICARDEGASRLGEVALVDREGRIGPLETVFYDTLLDENAASHIAFGSSFDDCADEGERLNRSAVHLDFMIGGDDVSVTGITEDNERVPVLSEGAWQL